MLQLSTTNQKLAQRHLTYFCPRCQRTFSCETDDEIFGVTTHRLVHVAAAWSSSFSPDTRWVADEDGPRPVVD